MIVGVTRRRLAARSGADPARHLLVNRLLGLRPPFAEMLFVSPFVTFYEAFASFSGFHAPDSGPLLANFRPSV
jgi:hypothetical protein